MKTYVCSRQSVKTSVFVAVAKFYGSWAFNYGEWMAEFLVSEVSLRLIPALSVVYSYVY
jgi:hypothetical protein